MPWEFHVALIFLGMMGIGACVIVGLIIRWMTKKREDGTVPIEEVLEGVYNYIGHTIEEEGEFSFKYKGKRFRMTKTSFEVSEEESKK